MQLLALNLLSIQIAILTLGIFFSILKIILDGLTLITLLELKRILILIIPCVTGRVPFQ